MSIDSEGCIHAFTVGCVKSILQLCVTQRAEMDFVDLLTCAIVLMVGQEDCVKYVIC
jgi:hypothetical protein